jgi:hypothetical protein
MLIGNTVFGALVDVRFPGLISVVYNFTVH